MQNRWELRVFLLMVLVLFSACIPQNVSLKLKEEAAGRVPDKHKTCDICHNSVRPGKGDALFAPGTDPSAVCLNTKCHPSYNANHHPVDFVPEPNVFVSPGAQFHLFEGKIRCLTCHDPHAGPGYTETPKFLRGGYPLDMPPNVRDRRRLCFDCHSREKYADTDLHKMIDKEGKQVQINGKSVCLHCHKTVPDPEIHRRSDVRFRADIAFICWRCHPPMSGGFFIDHFQAKPSKRVLDEIDRNEKSMYVKFPLIPRGRITCSTCHNPHQKEVMRDDRAMTGAGEPKLLRLKTPMICAGCHTTR